ncbi:Structure-specific endonuclease subunit SLX1 like [Schistosoma japonicum]|nr:Structure-specific endonuclease subunit SLX1 like [Schistosoma japonicum]KAH8877202.1 Structure-specific endonuclease subunit SLX1 like [Schistosoma japonicum]
MDGFECFDDGDSQEEDLKGFFYGCYILLSLNPNFRGRTYIGFTVNPKRRIRQHNAGFLKGGAKSTAGKGPWEMVLIVHGFPNAISALRFEWAWQNPKSSRRLKDSLPVKKPRETSFDYRLRVLTLMLCTGPWNRLGLIIQWIKQSYARNLSEYLVPPLHMPVAFGPIETKCLEHSSTKSTSFGTCHLCNIPFSVDSSVPLTCPNSCPLGQWHLLCLANYMTQADIMSASDSNHLQTSYLIPLSTPCPACSDAELLWPSLIKSWKIKTTTYRDSCSSIIL